MPLLFGILTALVLAISTWIGLKNKNQYELQISMRQKEEANFARESKTLQNRTSDWETTKAAKEELLAANEKLSDEISELESNISKLKSEIAKKEADKKRLSREVADAEEIFNKVGGVRALIPKIRGLRTDIATLTEDIATARTNLANLKQTKSDTDGLITKNERRVEHEVSGKSQPYLSISIKTVYSSWGFVTLNGGEIQGVVPGSTLEVLRDGDVVAKLKVTTVESNRAAADIIMDTLVSGEALRNGDKVVAEKISMPKNLENNAGGNSTAKVKF